jgi:hypothetical protein
MALLSHSTKTTERIFLPVGKEAPVAPYCLVPATETAADRLHETTALFPLDRMAAAAIAGVNVLMHVGGNCAVFRGFVTKLAGSFQIPLWVGTAGARGGEAQIKNSRRSC